MSTATGVRTPDRTGSPDPGPGVSLSPWTVMAVLVTAMVGMTVALLYGGAAAPREVTDPGALVRWGLPALETVHNVAMTVVLGALLFAVGVVPGVEGGVVGGVVGGVFTQSEPTGLILSPGLPKPMTWEPTWASGNGEPIVYDGLRSTLMTTQ